MFRKRSALRSGKLAKQRRRARYIKVAAALLVIAGAIVGVAYGLSRPSVTIKDVAIHGAEVLSPGDIEALVWQELSGHYFFLFPRRSVFIYPRHSAKTTVLDAYERVREIDILREGLQKIVVTVAERQPFATWCRDIVEAVDVEDIATTTEEAVGESKGSAEKCYFLDESGYIFAAAPQFTGDVYFRYYGSVEVDDPIGEYYVNEEYFRQLSFFLSALQGLDVRGTSLRVAGEDYEMRLSEGGSLLFGRDQDLTNVLNNLETVLLSDIFEEKGLADLEYVDLRFGNKVYYKFK